MQNNIESLFLPYEQALALKELGFDEDVLEYYNTETKEFCDVMKEIKAPLYQQAFRWFREKHDLDVISKPHIRKTKKYVCDPVNIRLEAKNTYEEAELECLKKLIQIIKEKL